eukprot:UN23085
MNRTKLKRPLCTNVFSPEFAKAFALSTTMIGSTTLYHFCGPVSLALGLSTLGLYNIVYTPLKQKAIWNTEVGAIVGALPPVVGIAAAHYAELEEYTGFFNHAIQILQDPYSLALFSLLYAWQLPHFMAICFWNKNDYQKCWI